jgi:hypothetical protein
MPKFALLAGFCALLMALAATAALSASGGTTQQNRQNVFSAITRSNISDVQTRLNGSANARNQIPAGTVLTYKTSTGNLGKIQILRYGYNLRARWVTYKPDGTVLSSGNNLLIRGTYTYDLDRGVQSKSADLWWEQVTSTTRYLVAMNGASFTIASYNPCELAKGAPGEDPCHKP